MLCHYDYLNSKSEQTVIMCIYTSVTQDSTHRQSVDKLQANNGKTSWVQQFVSVQICVSPDMHLNVGDIAGLFWICVLRLQIF